LINPNVQFSDAWLSFEGVPLKWHYPVGLLYDLYAGNEPFTPVDQVEDTLTPGTNAPTLLESEVGQGRSTQLARSWALTVHFTEWPEQHLVRLDGEGKYLHDAFINSVKEVTGVDGKCRGYWLNVNHQADFLRNGSGKVVMSLSKDDSTQLWEAVQNRTAHTLVHEVLFEKLT
jgi:autophagy-related protein 5